MSSQNLNSWVERDKLTGWLIEDVKRNWKHVNIYLCSWYLWINNCQRRGFKHKYLELCGVSNQLWERSIDIIKMCSELLDRIFPMIQWTRVDIILIWYFDSHASKVRSNRKKKMPLCHYMWSKYFILNRILTLTTTQQWLFI